MMLADLEDQIKAPIKSDSPIIAWMVEYASMLLTKYLVGDDGMTGYQCLHGQPIRERLPEFGETMYFYVPKRQRGKLDARWRVGVFLGRSLNSDQNCVGLSSGEVTRARGLVRLIPSKGWSRERLQRITTTPFTEKQQALDKVEEGLVPHGGPPKPLDQQDGVDPPLHHRRVKITHADLTRSGVG